MHSRPDREFTSAEGNAWIDADPKQCRVIIHGPQQQAIVAALVQRFDLPGSTIRSHTSAAKQVQESVVTIPLKRAKHDIVSTVAEPGSPAYAKLNDESQHASRQVWKGARDLLIEDITALLQEQGFTLKERSAGQSAGR